MPIILLWGNDAAALAQKIETQIATVVDPAWTSLNLSRFDGKQPENAIRALGEARTPPFGSGGRVVLLMHSPFCNECTSELANHFEVVFQLIPATSYLLLCNPAKPDGRLRSTKAIRAQVKQGLAEEQGFQVPAVWDIAGQRQFVERAANNHNLTLDSEGTTALIEAIGNDSARLSLELQKLSLYSGSCDQKRPITAAAVNALVDCRCTNVFQAGNALLLGDVSDAISLLDALLDTGEPALRIVVALSGQIRRWLWLSLLEQQGERSSEVIAKAVGISNPKQVYFMRKQLQGCHPKQLLMLLKQMLEIEVDLKRGVSPGNAFRDGLLS